MVPLVRDRYFSHRSGLESAWRCGRAGYLSQFHLGTGIQKVPRAYWLDVGVAVHLGLQHLMIFSEYSDAVQAALNYWDNCGQQEQLSSFNFTEQRVLIEALLWSFIYYTLPSFLESYEVLWVEQEITEQLTRTLQGPDSEEVIVSVERMSRPDVIVRDRQSGEIVVISWKTIDLITNWRKLFYRNDLQGLLEAAFSEQYFKESKKGLYKMLRNAPPDDDQMAEYVERVRKAIGDFDKLPNEVSYVQTIFLQKGKRRKQGATVREISHGISDSWQDSEYVDDYDETYEGEWTQDSFLLYPYCLKGDPNNLDNKVPGKPVVSWKWRYQRPGNVSYSTLGSCYKRELILLADPLNAVQTWVQALYEKAVFPSTLQPELGSPLESIIVWDEPQYCNRSLRKSIVEQTGRRELRRVEAALHLQRLLDHDIPFHEALDMEVEFEQRLTSCSHPFKCEFQDICFNQNENVDFWSDVPAGYARRIPHHVPEREYFEGLTQLEMIAEEKD